jgi:hypothetical protein
MAATTSHPAPVVDPETRHDPSTGDGDHDRFAHYVSRKELERAQRTGKPVTALCGKRWKPDADPSKYPMCPTCSEIVAEMMANELKD